MVSNLFLSDENGNSWHCPSDSNLRRGVLIFAPSGLAVILLKGLILSWLRVVARFNSVLLVSLLPAKNFFQNVVNGELRFRWVFDEANCGGGGSEHCGKCE